MIGCLNWGSERGRYGFTIMPFVIGPRKFLIKGTLEMPALFIKWYFNTDYYFTN